MPDALEESKEVMELTADNVATIFRDCLFKEDETIDGKPKDPEQLVFSAGINVEVGLNKTRLEGHSEAIKELLQQTHPKFKEGWTFLNFCMREDESIWTGFHQSMEELMILGIAIGVVKILSPKETWQIMPGGMPYIMVIDEK